MIAGKRIFVVEDDPLVQQTFVDGLESAGADVQASDCGDDLLAVLHDNPPHLALIDLRLPRRDGLSVLRDLREVTDLPVVLVTGQGDELDEIRGLEDGADDFLRKPFAIRVLIAHLVSVLRRYESLPAWDMSNLSGFLGQANWLIDERARQLRGPEGQSTPLTATEVRLLNVLAERQGQVVDRATLYARVFNRELSDQSRTIDVLVSRLRRKLEHADLPGCPVRLQSIYGKGYRLGEVE